MKRADLKVGMRVRERSRHSHDDMFVMSTEPWDRWSYGTRFRPATHGGRGVAVARESNRYLRRSDGSDPKTWRPDVVDIGQLVPAEEREAQEAAEQEFNRKIRERHERASARRKARAAELSTLTGSYILIDSDNMVVMSADDFTEMVHRLRGD